jgi:hypothetical protein
VETDQLSIEDRIMTINITANHRPLSRCCAGLFSALTLLALVGCATKPTPLYGWGSYQDQVYQYFKADGRKSAEEQILALQEFAEKGNAKGAKLPPGYHAHLGMLYASAGKDDLAIEQLQTEKTLFPESAAYMDRLLSKYKK